ncbi:unnamed protein product [Owenia fusiformis]|uniref:Uncharacterized protein n=1 Tax=Owenia fusiformis TaxID=6347 RepID=A0A8J1UYP1_OWEFU|nr:unnamed protein product [Owenia fusiformis]
MWDKQVKKSHAVDLMISIENQNLAEVKAIIEPYVNKPSLQLLCTAEARKRVSRECDCALFLAAKLSDPAILKYLLEVGVEPNFVRKEGFDKTSALHIAAGFGIHDNASALLAANADPNKQDSNGQTPLHFAIKDADFEMAKLLLSFGANADLTDKNFNAPIHIASKYGHSELANLILSYGANLYLRGYSGATPIHIASSEGHIALLNIFYSYKCNFNLKVPCYYGNREQTALHIACEKAHVQVVQQLVENFDADTNILDSHSQSPLHCLLQHPHDPKRMKAIDNYNDVAKILIKHKVNINKQNIRGETALHLAVKHRFHRIIELLLAAGADFNAETYSGKKAIDLVPGGDSDVTAMLRDVINMNPNRRMIHFNSTSDLSSPRSNRSLGTRSHSTRSLTRSMSSSSYETAMDQESSYSTCAESLKGSSISGSVNGPHWTLIDDRSDAGSRTSRSTLNADEEPCYAEIPEQQGEHVYMSMEDVKRERMAKRPEFNSKALPPPRSPRPKAAEPPPVPCRTSKPIYDELNPSSTLWDGYERPVNNNKLKRMNHISPPPTSNSLEMNRCLDDFPTEYASSKNAPQARSTPNMSDERNKQAVKELGDQLSKSNLVQMKTKSSKRGQSSTTASAETVGSMDSGLGMRYSTSKSNRRRSLSEHSDSDDCTTDDDSDTNAKSSPVSKASCSKNTQGYTDNAVTNYQSKAQKRAKAKRSPTSEEPNYPTIREVIYPVERVINFVVDIETDVPTWRLFEPVYGKASTMDPLKSILYSTDLQLVKVEEKTLNSIKTESVIVNDSLEFSLENDVESFTSDGQSSEASDDDIEELVEVNQTILQSPVKSPVVREKRADSGYQDVSSSDDENRLMNSSNESESAVFNVSQVNKVASSTTFFEQEITRVNNRFDRDSGVPTTDDSKDSSLDDILNLEGQAPRIVSLSVNLGKAGHSTDTSSDDDGKKNTNVTMTFNSNPSSRRYTIGSIDDAKNVVVERSNGSSDDEVRRSLSQSVEQLTCYLPYDSTESHDESISPINIKSIDSLALSCLDMWPTRNTPEQSNHESEDDEEICEVINSDVLSPDSRYYKLVQVSEPNSPLVIKSNTNNPVIHSLALPPISKQNDNTEDDSDSSESIKTTSESSYGSDSETSDSSDSYELDSSPQQPQNGLEKVKQALSAIQSSLESESENETSDVESIRKTDNTMCQLSDDLSDKSSSDQDITLGNSETEDDSDTSNDSDSSGTYDFSTCSKQEEFDGFEKVKNLLANISDTETNQSESDTNESAQDELDSSDTSFDINDTATEDTSDVNSYATVSEEDDDSDSSGSYDLDATPTKSTHRAPVLQSPVKIKQGPISLDSIQEDENSDGEEPEDAAEEQNAAIEDEDQNTSSSDLDHSSASESSQKDSSTSDSSTGSENDDNVASYNITDLIESDKESISGVVVDNNINMLVDLESGIVEHPVEITQDDASPRVEAPNQENNINWASLTSGTQYQKPISKLTDTIMKAEDTISVLSNSSSLAWDLYSPDSNTSNSDHNDLDTMVTKIASSEDNLPSANLDEDVLNYKSSQFADTCISGIPFDRLSHDGEAKQIEEPRFISFDRTQDDHDVIKLAGGNATGVYVAYVNEQSQVCTRGLKSGDRLLRVNGVDTKFKTREEVTLLLLSATGEVNLVVQEKMNEFQKLKESHLSGDLFYIRSNFNYHNIEKEDLKFRVGDIMCVTNTMYNEQLGSWEAVKLDKSNNDRKKGKIPNKDRAEQLALAQTKLGPTTKKSKPGVFRRAGRKWAKTRKKQKLQSYPSIDGTLDGYDFVQHKTAEYPRPVVLLGGLADVAMEKLSSAYPEKYQIPESTCSSSDSVDNIEYGIVREIIDSNKHPLIDIQPTEIPRLMTSRFKPIVIFLKHDSKKVLKDVRSRSPKTSPKNNSKIHNESLKLERLHSHLFDDTVNVNNEEWVSEVENLINAHQQKAIWTRIIRDDENELDKLDLKHIRIRAKPLVSSFFGSNRAEKTESWYSNVSESEDQVFEKMALTEALPDPENWSLGSFKSAESYPISGKSDREEDTMSVISNASESANSSKPESQVDQTRDEKMPKSSTISDSKDVSKRTLCDQLEHNVEQSNQNDSDSSLSGSESEGTSYSEESDSEAILSFSHDGSYSVSIDRSDNLSGLTNVISDDSDSHSTSCSRQSFCSDSTNDDNLFSPTVKRKLSDSPTDTKGSKSSPMDTKKVRFREIDMVYEGMTRSKYRKHKEEGQTLKYNGITVTPVLSQSEWETVDVETEIPQPEEPVQQIQYDMYEVMKQKRFTTKKIKIHFKMDKNWKDLVKEVYATQPDYDYESTDELLTDSPKGKTEHGRDVMEHWLQNSHTHASPEDARRALGEGRVELLVEDLQRAANGVRRRLQLPEYGNQVTLIRGRPTAL